MMRVSIEEVRSTTWAKIVNLRDQTTIRQLMREFSYVHPSTKSPTFSGGRDGTWDGTITLVKRFKRIDPNALFIPSGLIPKAKALLTTLGHEVDLTLDRYPLDWDTFEDSMRPGAMEFQIEAIRAWGEASGRGIIVTPPGSGKTSFIAGGTIRWALASGISPIIFVCQAIDVLYQSADQLSRSIGDRVGTIGDGKCELRPVTVSTFQSLASAWQPKKDFPEARRPEVVKRIEEAKLIIVDECHRSASELHQQIFQKAKSCRLTMGLTGTFAHSEDLEILIEAALGTVVYERPYSYYMSLPEPILARPTFIVYHMPRQRLPLPPHNSSSPASRYAAYYDAYVTNNEERNRKIVEFCRSLSSKGKSVAVVVTRLNHGETLKEMMPEAVWLSGSDPGDYRYEMFQAIREKRELILVSTLIKEAVDIPSLDAVVYAAAGDSKIAFPQSWRCMRSNLIDGKATKRECVIVTFFDKCKYLRDHSLNQIRMMNHDGFTIKHVGDVDPRDIQ